MYAVQDEMVVLTRAWLTPEERFPPTAPWPRLVRETAPEQAYGQAADPAPDSTPDLDPDPDDELFLLGERCAEAYLQSDALQYRAMTLLAQFHHREGWRDTGFGSTAEWLAWRIGIKPHAARERLRTALALEELPETAQAMSRGELSYTKVRTLTRAATPANEATLLEFARSGSAANLERVIRGWQTLGDRRSELTAEQIRHRRRRFSAWVDDDGTVVVRGRLDPEVGAVLMRAVEAAGDALFREDVTAVTSVTSVTSGDGAEFEKVTPEQRRADALGLVAERALAAGFGGNISGSRAERYQVMLHVDADVLEEDGPVDGRSELEDGTRVTAVTSRRVSCDAGLVEVAQGPGGPGGEVLLGAGRRRRTVPPAVRRALEARDRGCRFPGCGLRFTDAHHVRHWADGGETTLGNLVLLCRRHHRAVHEGGVRVCMDVNQKVVFFTPRGRALMGAPPVNPEPGRLRAIGSKAIGEKGGGPQDGSGRRPEPLPPIDAASAIPRYKRDSDIPWEVEARVWEVLDPG